MTVYENYDVITFKSCIQKFTVYIALTRNNLCIFSISLVQSVIIRTLKFWVLLVLRWKKNNNYLAATL